MTTSEKERLIRICIEVAAERVPIVVATGTQGTQSTIAMKRMAQSGGAAAALIVSSNYNRHFDRDSTQAPLPIIDELEEGTDRLGDALRDLFANRFSCVTTATPVHP